MDLFLYFLWMPRLLTFPCHSIWTAINQLTGSIPSELGGLMSLTYLWLRTWIGFSISYECHACSHFLAILFEQGLMLSGAPFRANSENWPCWLVCFSVRGLASLFLMNATLAHISLPFYCCNRSQSTLGLHSERTRRTDFVDWAVALYVDWLLYFLWMPRLLTFPCLSVRSDNNDLTGDLDPIFCDGSFLNLDTFDSDCLSEVVCSCCDNCY
jgi:hypothetical protein